MKRTAADMYNALSLSMVQLLLQLLLRPLKPNNRFKGLNSPPLQPARQYEYPPSCLWMTMGSGYMDLGLGVPVPLATVVVKDEKET